MERSTTMSTNYRNMIVRQDYADISDSSYQLDWHSRSELDETIRATSLSVATTPYSKWEGVAQLLMEHARAEQLYMGETIACFIVSPVWKADNRIVRHKGLKDLLKEEYQCDNPGFLFQKVIEKDGMVLFYGIVPICDENIEDVFCLVSLFGNGVLFSMDSHEEPVLSELADALAGTISTNVKSLRARVSIYDAIRTIRGRVKSIMQPISWEETGDYQLEIFS